MREVLDWESFDRGFVYSWRRYWRVNSHQGNLRKELQEAITASKQYLTTKDFAWQHGQFQLDTRRGITYLMDLEVHLSNHVTETLLCTHVRLG